MVRRQSSAGPPMAPPPSTKHVQVVAGPSLVVQEPPVDEAAAAERQADVARLLSGFGHHLQHVTDHHLGYPCNLDVSLDFSVLAQLQSFCINNLGDPFVQSNFGVHSKQFEIAVLDWFARVWELHRDQYWGYVTNGGTEGNLHGLLLGRELFPDGIMYTSCESHHSIFKAARMYRVKCVRINTLVSGEMDCADLRTKLLQNTGSPAVVNVNIGTTTKGAIDDLDTIISTLENCGFQGRFYIHCDAALSGLMLPFIKQAQKVTFRKPIGSVSVSGHKFLGCPIPCGVLITRREHVDLLSTDVEILSTRETTIMGSRNGHAPIFLWYTLNKKGYRGIQEEVQNCLRNADYLVNRLKQARIGASWNPLSNTVLFERPRDEIFVQKWQLACAGNIAHVVVMPNVTIEKLNRFVEDLTTTRARWFQDQGFVAPCIAKDIGQENCLCGLHCNMSQNDI